MLPTNQSRSRFWVPNHAFELDRRSSRSERLLIDLSPAHGPATGWVRELWLTESPIEVSDELSRLRPKPQSMRWLAIVHSRTSDMISVSETPLMVLFVEAKLVCRILR